MKERENRGRFRYKFRGFYYFKLREKYLLKVIEVGEKLGERRVKIFNKII